MTGDGNLAASIQLVDSGELQRQRRARTSKPKVKTGCNNCKYVGLLICLPSSEPYSLDQNYTKAFLIAGNEESNAMSSVHNVPSAFDQRRSAKVIRHLREPGSLKRSGLHPDH